MARKIKIDIPVLMGSNGKWSTMGHDPDWALLADNIMDGDKDPENSRKYIVRVTLEVPPAAEFVVADGVAEAKE